MPVPNFGGFKAAAASRDTPPLFPHAKLRFSWEPNAPMPTPSLRVAPGASQYNRSSCHQNRTSYRSHLGEPALLLAYLTS